MLLYEPLLGLRNIRVGGRPSLGSYDKLREARGHHGAGVPV